MLNPIDEVRIQVGDLDKCFPILADNVYEYFLSKNQFSVRRASLEAARAILLQLSMRTDQTVDVFSVKGSKVAEQYRLALQLFLKDPNMNPVFGSANAYAGGISNSDMQANVNDLDNNYVKTPESKISAVSNNPFMV